jgi:hypothetical protein
MDNLTIAGLFTAFGCLFFHEAGHYIIAFYNGWEPRVGFAKSPYPAFKVEGRNVHANTPEEIKNAINTGLTFSAAGMFGIFPAILFGLVSGLNAVGFGLALYFAVYSIWETANTFKLGSLEINPDEAKNGN